MGEGGEYLYEGEASIIPVRDVLPCRMLWSITVIWAFRKEKKTVLLPSGVFIYKKHTWFVFLRFLQEQIDCSWATVPNSRV